MTTDRTTAVRPPRDPASRPGDAVVPAMGHVLVLGVGNVLLRDEGVGCRVVDELDGLGLPSRIRPVDGGTLGLDLLPMFADAAALIIVDAVDLDADPGTVAVLHGDDAEAALGGRGVTRPGGVGELLSVARISGRLPDRIVLVAIQPALVEPGLDLTAAVQAAIPRAVELAVSEAAAALADADADASGA